MKKLSIYTIANKFPILMLINILIFFFVMNPSIVHASETETKANIVETNKEIYQHIYDEANLLSTAEYDKLEEMCINYSEDAGITIIILTHNNSKAVDGERYIEDFVDKMQYDDGVVLLVDMHNRDVVLEGYGLAEIYIHSKRGDIIIDEIVPHLTKENYVTAFELFVKRSAAFMKDDSELNFDHNYDYNTSEGNTNQSNNITRNQGNDNYNSYPYPGNNVRYSNSANNTNDFFTNIWFQLILSLSIGGITVAIMAYNAGGKMTAGGNNYIDMQNSGLVGRRDDYLRTRITRVRKPTQNNSGGGGFNAGGFRGGVSSGGRSHSTSRGKF